ncbi:DUF4180 domain-containing protein [Burkholderia stagnalis]|uniref:DUF4180 domain-containing protein n=1 Tax=Burkholderia stagnalis TaxID=1503054 RepID=UPI00075D7443|nr:DUF4180 domain-containing protein [Burkholderia stagnalis]KWH47825.1 alpha/beta hydrolase [Burkholderia stagnalis]KWH56574.1 alpha/beta hydrolase [Burkholderia stagnalis]
MSADVLTLGERRVLVCPRHVITLASEADAVTLIGDAWSHEASWVAAPVEAVHPDFFRLETRVLGGIVQKFANYGIGLAIVGDIDGWLARSQALRAFVHESRRGGTVRFVANLDALAASA